MCEVCEDSIHTLLIFQTLECNKLTYLRLLLQSWLGAVNSSDGMPEANETYRVQYITVRL